MKDQQPTQDQPETPEMTESPETMKSLTLILHEYWEPIGINPFFRDRRFLPVDDTRDAVIENGCARGV